MAHCRTARNLLSRPLFIVRHASFGLHPCDDNIESDCAGNFCLRSAWDAVRPAVQSGKTVFSYAIRPSGRRLA